MTNHLTLVSSQPLGTHGAPLIEETVEAWRDRIAPGFIGSAPAFLDALDSIRRVAPTHATVLVQGESGTGKEETAAALHRASSRKGKAFIAINCAAIPESLIESELFGHTRGAFTNAVGAREGSITAANGGTLFLDEIGDMPLAAQVTLLRVLQEREVCPVGGDKAVPVDIRLVAATNRDLKEMVRLGTFREDLYYRLSVISLQLPPLRERRADIIPLARHFVAMHAERCKRTAPSMTLEVEAALEGHAFRGNVRELGNVIERAVVLCMNGVIELRDLGLPPAVRKTLLTPTAPMMVLRADPVVAPVAASPVPPRTSFHLKSALDQLERTMIEAALDRTDGNRTEAAALLGLNRSTLVEKIRRFG